MVADDIVTRLREHWEDEKMLGNDLLCEVLRGASDEIERLRADVKRWSNWAIDYACDDMKCECDRCEAVRKAWDETQRNR